MVDLSSSLCNSHYQRISHTIKSHETTIFPWFSHGFPMENPPRKKLTSLLRLRMKLPGAAEAIQEIVGLFLERGERRRSWQVVVNEERRFRMRKTIGKP